MDIILLIFFCFKIAALAKQKNVSKIRWIMTTVFYWIIGGLFASSLLIFALGIDIEKSNMLEVMIENSMYFMLAGLLGGYLGYLFTRKRLEELPDANNAIE